MKTKLFKQIAFWMLLLAGVFLLASCGGSADTETEPADSAGDTAAADESTTEEESETVAETETDADTDAAEESDESGFVLAPQIAEKIANGEPLVLRVSYHDVSNEFAPFINMGVEQAAAEFGVDVEMVGPVSPDADAQIAELENLVAAGVDGLAISSVSSDALAPVIDRLIAEGIPVVTYNTDNPDSDRLAFAGQDLEQSGYEAAVVLAELMDGEGDVIITTLDAAAQWSIDRETGARRGFEEYPGINVLQTVNTGTEPQEIYASIENAMLANPTVTGILSLECCSVSPAGEYVKRNGLTGEVTVVGFDELPTTLQLIEEGVIAASLSQAPERQSYEAVRMLLDALNGETVSDVDTGIAVIDQSNLDVYMQDN